MTQETIEVRKLTASEGHVLTNGEVYGKVVYLGKNDTPENWREVSDEEYAEVLAQQEAKEQEPVTDEDDL